MPRPTTIRLRSAREATPIRIVSDAAIATGSVSEGRLVPLLIVDVGDRTEITELIRVHGSLHPGDVSYQWGQRHSKDDTILLVLEFERPVVLTMVLEFQIVLQGALVDLILRSRAFYLQAGRQGDRFLTTQDYPRLFIEAPNTGFEMVWDKLYLKHVTKELRRRGMGRSEAKTAAISYLAQVRTVSSGRMRS